MCLWRAVVWHAKGEGGSGERPLRAGGVGGKHCMAHAPLPEGARDVRLHHHARFAVCVFRWLLLHAQRNSSMATSAVFSSFGTVVIPKLKAPGGGGTASGTRILI